MPPIYLFNFFTTAISRVIFKRCQCSQQIFLHCPNFTNYFLKIPAGSVTAAAAGTGNAVIEEVDDIVTVEDVGEEIETIMVDDSVDVAISVSGEDSSVPVTIVDDESIPVDTVVETDGKYSC